MTEDQELERLPQKLRPFELLNNFNSVGHLVVATGKPHDLVDGAYHRVDKRGRVIMPRGGNAPERAPIWHFKILPYYENLDDPLPTGAVFEAYELSGIEHDAEIRPYAYTDIERLCEDKGAFVRIYPPRHKDTTELSPEVQTTSHLSRLSDHALHEKERAATAKALRELTASLARTRLDITPGAGDSPAQRRDRLTDAESVNQILRTARLPLEAGRYEALKSRNEKPGSGTYYLMSTEVMVREKGKVFTDPRLVQTVQTLVVRVKGADQHMSINTLCPAYMSTKGYQDETLMPVERQVIQEQVDKAYKEDRRAIYSLTALRRQIEDLQNNGNNNELRQTLVALGFKQVQLEFEEWRQRSGSLYKMVIPVTTVQIAQ